MAAVIDFSIVRKILNSNLDTPRVDSDVCAVAV